MRIGDPWQCLLGAHTPILAVHAAQGTWDCFNRWSPSARLIPRHSWGPSRDPKVTRLLEIRPCPDSRKERRLAHDPGEGQTATTGCISWPPTPSPPPLLASASIPQKGGPTSREPLGPSQLALSPACLALPSLLEPPKGLCHSPIWGTRGLSLKSRWRSSHFLLKPSSLHRKSNPLAAARRAIFKALHSSSAVQGCWISLSLCSLGTRPSAGVLLITGGLLLNRGQRGSHSKSSPVSPVA